MLKNIKKWHFSWIPFHMHISKQERASQALGKSRVAAAFFLPSYQNSLQLYPH